DFSKIDSVEQVVSHLFQPLPSSSSSSSSSSSITARPHKKQGPPKPSGQGGWRVCTDARWVGLPIGVLPDRSLPSLYLTIPRNPHLAQSSSSFPPPTSPLLHLNDPPPQPSISSVTHSHDSSPSLPSSPSKRAKLADPTSSTDLEDDQYLCAPTSS